MKTTFKPSAWLCALALALPAIAQAQTYTKTETIEYDNNTSLWVLGQVKRTTTIVSPTETIESSRTVYNTQAMPTTFYGFGNQVQQTVGYNSDGTVAWVKDGNNLQLTVSQWERGIPKRLEFADGNYLSAGLNANGWIAWVEDENRSRTCYTYDAMGRLASTTYPSETAGTPGVSVCNTDKWTATTYSWEWITVAEHGLPAGHWLRRVHTGNHRRNTFYDVMYRPVLVHFYDGGNVDATLQTTGTTYDASGNVTFTSYPVGTREMGTTGTWTEYDALDRPTSVTQDSELGPITTLTEYITGFQTRTTGPKGLVTHFEYQTFDQPTTEVPTGITRFSGPDNIVNEIQRDVFGKPVRIAQRNASGLVRLDRHYVYDARQLLCKTVEPETGATVMDYDAAGNLQWTSAGNALPSLTSCDTLAGRDSGRKVTRYYDNRNRLSSLVFPDGKGDQVWTYTATGKPATITTYNNTGNLEPVVNAYSYNRRGLMTGETSGQTGWYTWGLGYGYDTFGNLYNVNYADGLSIIYAPNAIGQPTQAGTYATGITYHRNGALKQFTYGNGIVHTMSQNARQLPARSTDSGGVVELGYVYDKNTNVASITDYAPGGNQSRTLSYDGFDRLTQAVGPTFGIADYGYNVLDDIVRLKVTGGNQPRDHIYNYDDPTHRLTSVTNNVSGATVIGLLYDSQGNLAQKNGQEYKFDYGNRLRGVPTKETYRYDGHGRRVYSNATAYAVWQYSNAGQLMFSHDARNNRATNYIYLQGSLLAMREAPMSGGTGIYTVKYQHTDALGTPIKVTNAAGAVVETSEYEPYGHLANRALTDGPGFTGHVQDAGTGLTYMQQRYYDPQVARFLSIDPVSAYGNGDMRFFNRYAYAFSNPHRFTDPDGRASTGEILHQWTEEEFQKSGGGAMAFALVFAETAWGVFGAEGVSQVYDKGADASTGDKVSAVIEVATIGKGKAIAEGGEAALKGGKSLIGKIADALKGGCSFDGETLVQTDRGLVPISRILIGVKVLSRNEETGIESFQEVVNVFREWHDSTLTLVVKADEGVEPIITTSEHPFFVDNRGFIPAADIAADDSIYASDGEILRVESLNLSAGRFAYNLTVANDHTYFVGKSHAWVHNSCNLGPVFRTAGDAAKAAEGMGFRRVAGSSKGGESVYRKGNTFISRDRTGHNGGAWKVADSVANLGKKETRLGTYNADLSQRIGD